jgi:hypothetical protein
VSVEGHVYSFGDATYYGGVSHLSLSDEICHIERTPEDNGYWLLGKDGGVFAMGSARFWGSLPQQFNFSETGNYEDYSDIIKHLLLWCGWWFYDPDLGQNSPAEVYGNIESTGIYAPERLTEDFFDKKPVIDIINTIKEIVGYIIHVDEVGAFHFESPNVWSIGNFFDTGIPTSQMFVCDEAVQLTDYAVSVDYQDARSTITIASADPKLKHPDTISTTVTSQWGGDALNGIVKPALWVNGKFIHKNVQKVMAQLIDLHIFMASRQGSVTIPANPIIQINDQIRIYERVTSDTYIHYVRGYTSSMDLESGSYTMTIQTHWMGDGDEWFLDYD